MTQTALKPTVEPETPQTGIDRRVWIATALNGVLADSMVLFFKTQSYRWNVVGPLFQPLHEMTEKQYTDLFDAIDVIAERIRALGQVAPLSFTDSLAHAHLTEEDAERSAAGMLEQLIADHEKLVRRLRETAKLAARHDDGATEDLMNSRMAAHEQAIWMLKAIAA